MANEADIKAALVAHQAELVDVGPDQLAWLWRDELASIDPALVADAVEARLAEPRWALYRRAPVAPPVEPGPAPGSLEAISAPYRARGGLGLGGPVTGGLTSADGYPRALGVVSPPPTGNVAGDQASSLAAILRERRALSPTTVFSTKKTNKQVVGGLAGPRPIDYD